MKIGTILENPWTTKENPLYRSIYMGVKGRYFETMYFNKGVCTAKYNKSDLDKFKIIGETKGFDVMKQELKED